MEQWKRRNSSNTQLTENRWIIFIWIIYRGGDVVIKQGDDGDNLYVVDQGQLDCFKEKGKDEKLFLKTYKEGEAFGKLKNS